MKKVNLKFVESRDKVKIKAAEVGRAVYDIMSKPQASQEVGETLEAMSPKYIEHLLTTIKDRQNDFDGPFYIVVLRKKEPWALNVLRQWYVPRQTRPSPYVLREDYPNHDHDVWCIDPKTTEISLQWTLPTAQDSKTILKNASLYDPTLVQWIQDFDSKQLR